MSVNLLLISTVSGVNDDFLYTYNRYPDLIQKVSIFQYNPDKLIYNEQTNQIEVHQDKDIFGRIANNRSTFHKSKANKRVDSVRDKQNMNSLR